MLNYWHNSHICLCIFTSDQMWNTTRDICLLFFPSKIASSNLPLCHTSSPSGPLLSQEIHKSTSASPDHPSGVPQINPSLPLHSSLTMLLATLLCFPDEAPVWRRWAAQWLVRWCNSWNLYWEWQCQVSAHSPSVLHLALGQSTVRNWL